MIQSGPRELGDRDVRLREITMADAPDLFRWRMDETSRHMFRSVAAVTTMSSGSRAVLTVLSVRIVC